MKKALYLILFFTLSGFSFVFAQQPSIFRDSRSCFQAVGHYALYYPFEARHAYMKQLPQYGIDLKWGLQTDGSNFWESVFNKPSYGVFIRMEKNNVDSILYTTRNAQGYEEENWKALGDCYSVGGFLNGHLYRGKYWSFDYDIMGGLSFWTRYLNEFIGSVTNVHLAIDAGPTFMIEDNLDVCIRYQFSHSSNAALALPNCGINVFSWLLGVRYFPNQRPVTEPAKPFSWHKTTALFVSESLGAVQTNQNMRTYQTSTGEMVSDLPQERPIYLADVLQIGMHRKFHPKFSCDVALDLSWTGKTKRMFEKAHQDYNDNSEALDVELLEYGFSRGLHLAPSALFEINYGRFAFCIGGAYYLWHGIYHGTHENKTWGLSESSESAFEDYYLPPCYRTFYERLGFKLYLGENRNMYVGSFMKVHEVVIDYAEFSFGINLHQWKGKERTRL